MSRPNAYEVLGVPKTASMDEIKQAYKALAKQHHPDLCAPGRQREVAEAYFKEITSAYSRLTQQGADWRAQYAETMATGHSGASGGQRAYARAGSAAAAARHAPKFSNGVIAAVLALPLLLSGIHLSRAYQNLSNDPFRPGGALAPPQNPWLREDLYPSTHSGRTRLFKQWQGERAAARRREATAGEGKEGGKGGQQQQARQRGLFKRRPGAAAAAATGAAQQQAAV